MTLRPLRPTAGLSFAIAMFVLTLAAPSSAADVCVSVDETRDTFSTQDRTAAILLLSRQFEMEGERVVATECPNHYVISHVQLGTTITITLSGPKGQRDATARGIDDVPAVYSQMVRSLIRGVPMNTSGIVDRGNVSNTQAATPNRIHADSLFYARLGYAAVFGDSTHGGPSVGFFGYRRELDSFGIDVSFFNFQYEASNSSYYGPASSGSTGTWLKLAFLHFASPKLDKSLYFGGGLAWSTANLNNNTTYWRGSGLQGELLTGYELGRASSIRVFIQSDVGLPFYTLSAERYAYSNTPPYVTVLSADHQYSPSVALSLGIGWQRGGGGK